MFSSKLWIAQLLLFLVISQAWPFIPGDFDSISIIPRDGDEDIAGCGPGCKACIAGTGCTSNSKRSPELSTYAWFTQSDGLFRNQTQHAHLSKRVLQQVNEDNAGQYVTSLSTNPSILGVTATVRGSDASFTRQEQFSNWPNTNNPLRIGTYNGFLTGCSMLTIVSKRAVYVGHFWQNLAFSNENPQPGDEPPNFEGNVVNLIKGQTPLFYATGPALDTSLFNQPGDRCYSSIMTPRHNTGNKGMYYPKKIGQLEALIHDLLPECRQDRYKYFSQEADKYPVDSGRGVMMFEYDADADGNGNGDWRLWYETTVQRGRLLGQGVIPAATGLTGTGPD